MDDQRAGRVSALAAAFREQVGAPATGIWAAPGRVNLIGEHTDYNDGWVLPTAIERDVLAAARLRDDGVVTCSSLDLPGRCEARVDDLGPGSAAGWPAYVLGVVWALREAGAQVPGLSVVVGSDVPVGAGLSSSAAIEAAVGLALVDLTGAELDRTALAQACRRAETDVVGAPVGIMDQMASLLGREDCALLLDCRSLESEPVPLHLADAGLVLLVIDTKVDHAHAGGEYAERRRACEQAAAALGVPALRDATLHRVESGLSGELLRCARHIVTENARVLETVAALAAGRVADLGAVFAASHASMRDDFRISCPELDVAVAAAVDGGALAARMTGGGFGGCAVALVPADREHDAGDRVRAAFAEAGFAAPDVFPVRPSAGASRLC